MSDEDFSEMRRLGQEFLDRLNASEKAAKEAEFARRHPYEAWKRKAIGEPMTDAERAARLQEIRAERFKREEDWKNKLEEMQRAEDAKRGRR